MRLRGLFAVLALLLLLAPGVAAYSSLGADFRVDDSDESSSFAPLFTWDDVSAGTLVTWDFTASLTPAVIYDENTSNSITLPFAFPFYGGNFNTVKVGSNGFLSFDSSFSASPGNGPIPSTNGPENVVAVFWDDLNPTNGTSQNWNIRYGTFGTGADQRFVVQWTNARLEALNTAQLTFQVALYANGAIRMQYQTMNGGGSPLAQGSSATVGLENGTGTLGEVYLHNGGPAGNETEDSLAIGFTPNGQTATWPVTGTGTTTTGGTTTGGGGAPAPNREGDNGDGLCSAGSGGTGTLSFVLVLVFMLGVFTRKN